MPIVRLDKVSLSFSLKPLLDNIALQIRKGERVCLLGRNGEGKSSLLQVITRQIIPDGTATGCASVERNGSPTTSKPHTVAGTP